MEKNQIFITCGTEYKEMTKRILEESGLAEQIGNKAFRIGIKPNMVSPSHPSNGATTHAEVLAGIKMCIRDRPDSAYSPVTEDFDGNPLAEGVDENGYFILSIKQAVSDNASVWEFITPKLPVVNESGTAYTLSLIHISKLCIRQGWNALWSCIFPGEPTLLQPFVPPGSGEIITMWTAFILWETACQ